MYDYPVPRDSLCNFYTSSISSYVRIQGVSVMRDKAKLPFKNSKRNRDTNFDAMKGDSLK